MKKFKLPCHQIIIIDGYRYAVSDHNVKDGDWVIYNTQYAGIPNIVLIKIKQEHVKGAKVLGYMKVIATNNLDLPDVLWLPEPDGQEDEQDIKELAAADSDRINKSLAGTVYWGYHIRGFVNGYKAAKGKGTYSEDDLREAFRAGQRFSDKENIPGITEHVPNENEFIKSLKPEPIGVEFETFTNISHTQIENQQFREMTHEEKVEFIEKYSVLKTQKIDGKDSVIIKRWIYGT